MVHIALGSPRCRDAVQRLPIAHGPEGDHGHDLRLAAGEHGAAVRAGQTCRPRTRWGAPRSALRPSGRTPSSMILRRMTSFVEAVQRVADLASRGSRELLGEVLDGLGLDLLLARLALVAVEGLERPLHLVIARIRARPRSHPRRCSHQRELALFLADLGHDAVDEGDDLLDLLVREAGWRRSITSSVTSLAPASTIMIGVLGAAPRSGAAATLAALLAALGLMTYSPSTRPTTTAPVGPAKGMSLMDSATEEPIIAGTSGGVVRDRRTSTVATTCTSLRMPLGKQRAQRAVDQAAGQDGLFGGTAFALDEAAGDLAHGVHAFLQSPRSAGRSRCPGAGVSATVAADQHARCRRSGPEREPAACSA